MPSDYDRFIIIPDTQWPFEDRKAERALMHYTEHVKPDLLIHIGDACDFYSLADFRKKMEPSKRMYFSKEVEYGRAKLKAWSAVAPKSRRILIEGNHEARLARYLETKAPELFDLYGADLSVPSVLRLADSGWEYVGPYGAGFWVGKKGGLWATHGQYCSDRTIPNMLKLIKCSFVQGHTHRLRFAAETSTLTGKTIGGYEIGTLADPKKTPRNTPHVNWQRGFAHGWVSRKSKGFHLDLVSINGGKFVVDGREWRG